MIADNKKTLFFKEEKRNQDISIRISMEIERKKKTSGTNQTIINQKLKRLTEVFCLATAGTVLVSETNRNLKPFDILFQKLAEAAKEVKQLST